MLVFCEGTCREDEEYPTPLLDNTSCDKTTQKVSVGEYNPDMTTGVLDDLYR